MDHLYLYNFYIYLLYIQPAAAMCDAIHIFFRSTLAELLGWLSEGAESY